MEKLPKGSSGIDHDHLDSALAEPFEVKGLNTAVGDDEEEDVPVGMTDEAVGDEEISEDKAPVEDMDD